MGCYAVTALWEKVQTAAGKAPHARCVVLYYHAMPLRQRKRFARQMDILLRCAKPAHPELKAPLSPGLHAAVTFDDGYQSVVENALPELQKRNIPFAFFVVSHALGGPARWIPEGEAYRPDEGDNILSAEQLRRLPANLVVIGSHTMSHPQLPELPEEAAKQELTQSRALLEQVLQREIRLFSFPHGAFNSSLVKWCREAGYERVFSIEPVMALSDPHEYVTGRVWADADDWNLEFRLKVLGAYRWLPAAFEWKRKLLGALKKPSRNGSH